MKIKTNQSAVNISALLKKLKEKYKTIFMFQFGEQVFIYRPIGRKEYKDLVLNENYSEQEKEEIECATCVLYPENYDFANCEEAGLPTQLACEIERNSYISEEGRKAVLTHFRSDMFDLDNQINCMIISAFPNLSLEEVENWDVMTACKYLSRAEWILTRIKGVPMNSGREPGSGYIKKTEEISDAKPIQKKETSAENISEEAPETSIHRKKRRPPVPKSFGPPIEHKESGLETPNIPDEMLKSISSEKTIAHNGKPKIRKQQMTQEKLAELKAKYPEIDWEHDAGQQGFDSFKSVEWVDPVPPALRTRGKSAPPKKPEYIYYTPDLENKNKE